MDMFAETSRTSQAQHRGELHVDNTFHDLGNLVPKLLLLQILFPPKNEKKTVKKDKAKWIHKFGDLN